MSSAAFPIGLLLQMQQMRQAQSQPQQQPSVFAPNPLTQQGGFSNPLMREPFDSERDFFSKNKGVGGMASQDNRVVLNPFSKLNPEEMRSIVQNETYRVNVRTGKMPRFKGSLTPEQMSFLNNTEYYSGASEEDRIDTIMARLISGDPSAGQPSSEQLDYIRSLRTQPTIEGGR